MSTLCSEKLFALQPPPSSRLTYPSLHVAIIMDGNTDWALRYGQPSSAGHAAGAANIHRIAGAAAALGVGTLTVYACSEGNSLRPTGEIRGRMNVLAEFLRLDTSHYLQDDIRVSVIGRRDRLSTELAAAMEFAETATAQCGGLHLRIAIDYSSREAIFRAACRFYKATRIHRESFEEVLGEVSHGAPQDVDLLIRTGNEHRLSDFLLWEAAEAELQFSPLMWPDFTESDLAAVLKNFHARQRGIGQISNASSS